ncbi:type III secretion exporter [Caldalkalibacillus thermarum TA2.A1]|uniref:EscU/YscU/HrcU family type III secretion system export apparatus switch protein n=1 Tax=Caldalkalibacillus thermarum (strain TA2.A1) TaxID=986075 RepID=F5L8I1_CALTT|nr:EscU/YscU/HrcU family type III secretion system export apparatus switch protein [Caldalkalibacillus thermarum]EGL82320.1 type III secretion exporter [Caldalkalibacillus thermarum TA2.A1]QZT32885.1 EscU/YscU/HrcU family type III secretion system export apparatus switch protein [Caldalkalibacillus thermarum TA2.A1]
MKPENKPPKKAVALHYDPEQHAAPVVKAKGTGPVAERIIELAKQHDIPIYEDPSLVELLSKIELNEQIPEELYTVIAEILAMIYELEQKAAYSESGLKKKIKK